MPENNDFEVWAECEQALSIFLECRTQWNYSFSGITGLNYLVVIQIMDSVHNVKKKHRKQLMSDIMSLESGALSAFNDKTKE